MATPTDDRAAFRWPAAYRVLIALIALVVGGFYLWCVQASNPAFEWRYDKVEYYDLLGRGLARGHLYLAQDPSPQLLALPNPWDVRQSGDLGLQDAVLYNRRYYLYHGVTPVILLFTPWRLVTGRDMPEPFAAFLFCLGGYLFACATLLLLLSWMGTRPSLPVLGSLLLAIGASQPAPFLLQRVYVYEIAIAGGYFCLSAGFWFLARGTLAHHMSTGSLALSGLSFGLAAGSRPHLGVAGACALGFLIWQVRRKRPLRMVLLVRETMAFVVPLATCALALGVYNYARFGDPFEFGLRYQLADPSSYAHLFPAVENVSPGLYYFFVSLPDVDPVFPFLRLILRDFSPLPKRYFLEPTAGILVLCPLLLLVPLLFRRCVDATARAFASAVFCFGLICALAVSSLGLTSQRYEMDFLPYLMLVACFLAALPSRVAESTAPKRRLPNRLGGQAVQGLVHGLLIFGIAAGFFLGVQGPYDEFVQRHPAAYVNVARLFSPISRYRPIYNPELTIEADVEFPHDPVHGAVPLIAAGRLGSRYLLTAEILADNRVKLTAATALRAPPVASADVDATADGPNRIRLEYRPATGSADGGLMIVSWNGQPALRHAIPFLVTAPSQVVVGENGTELTPSPNRFPGRWTVRTKVIDKVNW